MPEFKIDQDRIDAIVKKAYDFIQRNGDRVRKYMPQYNLPSELEYSPRQKSTKDPLLASQFLLTEAFFERRTQSRQIIRSCLSTWEDTSSRWIFDQKAVTNATIEEITKIMEKLPYTAHQGDPRYVSKRYRNNAIMLKKKFDSDPRNLIIGKTAEEARHNLNYLWGIGNGIANLYIVYLIEREIASPTDPEHALLKIDIHKARIPFNVRAITTDEKEVRRSSVESILEQAYWKSCTSQNLPADIVDGAIWVIGSEICSKKDYGRCHTDCPLVKMCETYVHEDKENGKFILSDEKGEMKEHRRNRNQMFFNFGDES